MKKMFYRFFVVASVCSIFLIIGCEGSEGPVGPAGEDGNANVKSEIIRVFGYDWEYIDGLYGIDIYTSLITQDIVNSGLVYVFLEAGDGIWFALPYQTMGFAFGQNDLAIWTQGQAVTTQTTTFRLVVIEGELIGKAAGINFKNYEEVKSFFNLKD